MKHKIQFISLEEDDKDLIVSFAVDDEKLGVKSLILHYKNTQIRNSRYGEITKKAKL
jgi:hypothetical protein